MKRRLEWRVVLGKISLGLCLLAASCSGPFTGNDRPEDSILQMASQTSIPATTLEQRDQVSGEIFAKLATQTAASAQKAAGSAQETERTPSPEDQNQAETQITESAPKGEAGQSPSGTPPLPATIKRQTAPFQAILPQVFAYRYPLHGVRLWVDPALPDALQQSLKVPEGVGLPGAAEEADLRLEVIGQAGDSPTGQTVLSTWVYALVTPFPTLEQGVSIENVKRLWRGGDGREGSLLMDSSTLAVFSAFWGPPGDQSVQVMPENKLLDYAWENQPSWALIPFESLKPRWTVLEVEGQSPLRKRFDPAAYPLSVPVGLRGDADLVEQAANLLGPDSPQPLLPPTNRDPEKLTTLAMTGVTALVRATADTMERKGIRYPGQDIRSYLLEADLTHVSNEVPFARDCPPPNPVQEELRFCSDPSYIELLEDVGTDIIELTGDHFQDWGAEAMRFTLKLYEERGWLTYGGGANLAEARQAVELVHNGNRLAFIGCNAKGGGYAQAGEGRPGAVACDRKWMEAEVARLSADGYLPIATFQHFEYYNYEAQPDQRRDFRALAEAGAVIVSGSQAHQPQGMEFLAGAFIHYGLGNLFFDQFDVSQATQQGFIDRHIFYDGRYLGVELLPILFVDYARARPMTANEREDLLRAVFSASGW